MKNTEIGKYSLMAATFSNERHLLCQKTFKTSLNSKYHAKTNFIIINGKPSIRL